jgi:DNA repair protein RecN (Recombination protein N)
MLLQISIKNFALIENLSVSFDSGFNVLSGETGAGKSILIDAINYILGSKFSRDLIRTGKDKTYVEAVFTIDNSRTEQVLNELEIEFDDVIIISRETFSTGKSIVKVNGKSLILSNLKILTSTLLDIHGQHENQNLLDNNSHILYLDSFSSEHIESLLNIYKIKYEKLNSISKKIQKLKDKNHDKDRVASYLKYQIDEIDAAKLRLKEDSELEERFSLITHAEKINNTLNNCYSLLYNGNETTQSIYDLLSFVIKDLKTLEPHMDKVKGIVNSLEEAYYSIEENISDIRDIKDTITYDENELSYINNRIFIINSIKRKYGNTIEEILDYNIKLKEQYDELCNSQYIIDDLEKEYSLLNSNLRELAVQVHDIRTRSAKILQKRIKDELDFVGLEKSTFNIEIELEDALHSNGCDRVQFLISTNPGAPLKPLDKVVSGGELSRIMLALKTVFVDKDSIPTVIFDEIDTGISGRIAQSVAEKMYQISTIRQILCVTHLPQIASMSDSHYLVHKDIINDKTYVNVKRLTEKDKEVELAKMISGSVVTNVTLENSKELINLAKNKKEIIVQNYKKN